MPKELIEKKSEENRKGPREVYVSLMDLISLQYQARGFSFLPKYAVQSLLSGRHRSKLRGRGLDFDQVRKYVKGDDIRYIDWRVTARAGVTHTKEFTEERERPVFFIVDQSSSMFFGTKFFLKSVVAGHIAALGCWRVLDVGDRAGGMVFNDNHIDCITPKRDRRTVQRYLSLITSKNQELSAKNLAIEGDFHPLNKSLEQANNIVTHDYLIIVISDFQNANTATLKNLIRLKKNNDVIVAHVSDPGESTLIQDRVTMTDGQYQTRLGRSKKLRNKFKEEKKSIFEVMKADFKKYGIPIIPFDTMSEPTKQLRTLLGSLVK